MGEEDSRPSTFVLGPHTPELRPADVELVHHVWRELTERHGVGPNLHHRDVVSLALECLDDELHSPHAAHVVNEIRHKVLGKEISPPAG